MKMSFSKNSNLNFRDKGRMVMVIVVEIVMDFKAEINSNKEVTNL